MLTRPSLRLLVAACVITASAGVAQAQTPIFSSESLGFVGTWKSYATLADAQAGGSNFLHQGGVGQQNLALQVDPTNGSAIDRLLFQSHINSPTSAANFLGVVTTTPATSSSITWDNQNNNYTSMTVKANGATADGISGFDPNLGLTVGTRAGNWQSYDFYAQVIGLANGAGSPIQSDSNPKDASGYFKGIFQNLGGGAYNGQFFTVDLTVNAINNLAPGDRFFPTDLFVSNSAVPEPTSCLAFAMIFAASAGYGWRRRQQSREATIA